MPLTALGTRRYGFSLSVHSHLIRTLPVALALTLACAKGADRAVAPLDRLHFPAWVALNDDQLLVVNADQDLAFEGGSLVGMSPDAGVIQGGVALPYMPGKPTVADDGNVSGCKFGTFANLPFSLSSPSSLPFAIVPGRSDEFLYFADLPLPSDAEHRRASLNVQVDGAANPFEAALTCGADHKARAWVSYQRGVDEKGYVAQIDLSADVPPPEGSDLPLAKVVKVFTGNGPARSFAWDPATDRLYFTTREHALHAPIRWISVGNGCKESDGGVQDEAQGGCHVDMAGIDLSSHLAGAEPNAIALSSAERPCVFGGGSCRRMYLTVRMYDADLAKLMDQRPAGDIGGKLVILELFENGSGGPEVRWIDDVDIGKIAGDVLVIPRPEGDVVVATAVTDDLVWIYDDARGTVAKTIGRLASGVPEVGSMPSGLASRNMGNGNVRVFVASYEDHWVSAVDVPLANPEQAYVVREGADPKNPAAGYLRLGRSQ